MCLPLPYPSSTVMDPKHWGRHGPDEHKEPNRKNDAEIMKQKGHFC